MNRRPAVTLLEAIMAIFVMAIGLLALLTLFPLGAIQMAQAIKDERTAESSINAVAQYKSFGLNNDPSIVLTIPQTAGGGTIFENPWPAANAPPGLQSLTTSSYAGPTYAVMVDPPGATAGASVVTAANASTHGVPSAPWPTAGGVTLGIPRVTASLIPVSTAALVQRWFYLQDDIAYNDNGFADLTPGFVQREGRYSWVYMVRRAFAGDKGPLDLTVVVYSGRLAGVNAAGAPLGEATYGDPLATPATTVTWGVTALGAADPYTVTINYANTPGNKPALRRGKWIMDARQVDSTNGQPAPQGYFYRVVSVNETSPTMMEIQVQRPLGGQLRGPNGLGSTGPLVVVDSVSEVFEQGTSYTQ
jgi:hypothetical protein